MGPISSRFARKYIDHFKTEKKAKGGKRYLPLLFFPFPAVSLTPPGPPFVNSAAGSSFLTFFSLVPAPTDDMARLRVTVVLGGDGRRWPLRVVEVLDRVSGMVWRHRDGGGSDVRLY